MPTPIALCLEDCHPAHETERYLRCCAVSGRQQGLVIALDGRVLWKTEARRLCEVWVSVDEKLICYRPPGAPAGARVHRQGREVALEEGKPVVVIDQDLLLLPDRRYRIHVHGPASVVSEPVQVHLEPPTSSPLVRIAAAGAVAIGALSGAACEKKAAEEEAHVVPMEVRENPPMIPVNDDRRPPTVDATPLAAPPPEPMVELAPPPSSPGGAEKKDDMAAASAPAHPMVEPMKKPRLPAMEYPIEIRENPPMVPPPGSGYD